MIRSLGMGTVRRGDQKWSPLPFCAKMEHMSVVTRILYDDPDALYVLSGNSPFVDRSRRRLANISPANSQWPVSPLRGLPGTVITSTLATVTLHKAPSKEFTFFSWFKPRTTNSTNAISYNAAYTEGIWQVGNTMNFGIRHIGGALTTATAEVDGSRGHLVFGVYDGIRVMLYVDGVQVASKLITSTALVDTTSTVYVGDANSTIFGVAGVFHKAVSGAVISSVQQAAKRASLRTDALAQFGAADLRIEAGIGDYDTFAFDDTTPSLVSLAAIDGTTVKPSYDTSLLSIASSVKFVAPFVDNTNGVRVSWGESNGAVVEYSTDDTVYTAVYNGQTILGGVSTTNQPFFKISFPAGSSSEMYLKDFRADRITSTALVASMTNGREVTLSGSVSLAADYDFRDYPHLPSTFGTNGVITIAADAENATNTVALEFWFTPTASDLTGTKYILDSNPDHASTISLVTNKLNFSGFSTVYVNKSSVTTNTFTMQAGVPHHIVAVYTTANNTAIKLGRTTSPVAGNLSAFGIIRQAFSAGNVTTLFDAQQDAPVTALASNSSLTLTDSAVQTYQLVWTAGAQ